MFGDDYVRSLYGGQISIAKVFSSYVARLRVMLRAKRFDLAWIEKEMLPWLPEWIEVCLFPDNIPIVVDYDDAVFHRYDQHRLHWVRALLGRKIDAVMRRADLVIVGNDYLGDRATRAPARRVALLPTVVDTNRYGKVAPALGGPLTIGWIGTPSTAHYLRLVASVLQEMVTTRDSRVVAVGANAAQLKGLPIEVRPWSEQSEVMELQQFDIGIMPLPNEPFERGKCGYKLIQYMSCGIPVVASPIGANRVIVREGVEGFLPADLSQWGDVIGKLCDDAALRKRLGAAGRERVEAEYSLQVTAPRLEKLLCSVVKTPCVA
jgi:glycosyltransferase involved in cell wall biosynthesis